MQVSATASFRGNTLRRATATATRLAAAVFFIAVMLGASTGSALGASAPGVSRTSATATCPTDPYTHGTIQSCTTTTQPVCPSSAPLLTVSYMPGAPNGVVTWQVTGLPLSALGSTETVELNGRIVSSAIDSVVTDGCSSDPVQQFSACLGVGTVTVTAIDPPYPTLTNDVSITSSGGCLTAATGPAPANSSGALAFTGTDALSLVAVAAALLVVGYATVLLARRRRSTRSIP